VEPINLLDYEALAQQRLQPAIWDYFQGGSEDEVTMRANRASFDRFYLRPRVLVDVNTIDMRTTVLGMPVSMPVLVAPTASHKLAHPDGECATARGAGEAGTIMIVSTSATCSAAEVAEAATAPLWFQLYSHHTLETTGKLVKLVEAAGYRAIVLTVDSPYLGRRERDLHNQFILGQHVSMANFSNKNASASPSSRHLVDTWETVDWLRSMTALPILLKGILTAEDARLAAERGIDGIVVSNHGGRQLDGAIASLDALPEVVEAVAGRCEVYVDGGIRRGTDVLKALALGARAVLLGRSILWGLAVNGQEGVHHVLELLRAELELAMALSGRPTLASIDRSLLKVAR
jgi:isopentenyl diphosphate isomerase/L-lactate dehydrogenase-like FMN-dependent dehydrogenase